MGTKAAAPVTAVIVAAGSGERLRAGGPKAFVPLCGKRMVEWSVAAFRAVEPVRSLVVACPPGYAHDLDGEALEVVDGGEARAESVANALATVDTGLVAIHDAARPLVTPELIEGTIDTLLADDGAAGAIAATPVTDTIKQVGASGVVDSPIVAGATLDRDRLWAAQTPQVFRTEALRSAVDAADSAATATDEAMLVEAAGGRVLIHPSPPENLKVTTPLDLRLAELLLSERLGAD